jgi:hypothetical protein
MSNELQIPTEDNPIARSTVLNNRLFYSLIPVFCFLLSLAFYMITLQPSLAWGDGTRLQREVITAESFILAEMVDVSFARDPYPFARLGVAAWDHPLYVMLGHTLVRNSAESQSLWLVNFISAVFASGTLVILYLLALRHTRSLGASLLAAATLAVSHTFWWHAVTPEVYTLFTFLLLLAVYCLDSYENNGRFVSLIACAFFLGLGISNHLLAALALLALPVYLLLIRRSPLDYIQKPVHLLWLLLAFVAGLLPYLVQFLRLLRTFSFNEIFGPAAGVTFLRGSLALSPAGFLESLTSYLIFLFYNFLLVGVLVGLLGFSSGSHRLYPGLWAKALAFYGVYLIFGLFYRVSDQFAFFLAAHLFWAVAVAMGIAYLAKQAASARQRKRLFAALSLPILLTPMLYSVAGDLLRAGGVTEAEFGVPQIGIGVRDGLTYYVDPNKMGDVSALIFGYETLANLPPEGLVIAQWYTDTDEYFVLRYFQVVEAMRPDVTLLGWPTEDPFTFDPGLVGETIAANVDSRPLYLASLSEQFYAAPDLLNQYCIVEEHNLYRVYMHAEAEDRACLLPSAAMRMNP